MLNSPLRNLALDIGQLLMVDVNDEILIGKLKFINPNGKMIELEHVRDMKTNYIYSSPQILALPQIKAIKIIHNDEEATSASTSMTQSSSTNTSLESDCCASVNLSSTELQQLQAQLRSTVYIVQTDRSYHKALADLKCQAVVALVADPLDCHRHCRSSVLALATQQTVYIFDMLALGNIQGEFRRFLEAEQPRKIVHNSPYLVDHLHHRYDLQLAGIFDTFVAYCYISNARQTLDLLETVQRTFNIAEMYFDHETGQALSPDPYQRPLTPSQLQLIAKKAIFQLKLYDFLLHKRMLATFYRQCSSFSKTFSQNEDVVDVAMKMHYKSEEGFKHIECIDELKQTLEAQFSNLLKQ